MTPSSQGKGYSGFQVTGMLECGQKSTLPPPPRKKSKGFLTKPKKSLHKNLTPPPQKKKTKQNLPRETLYPDTGTECVHISA